MVMNPMGSQSVKKAPKQTLPETNIAPANRPSLKEISSSNHPFSRAMLVSGRVNKSKKMCVMSGGGVDTLVG